MKPIVVVAWHRAEQKDAFIRSWKLSENDPRVHFQQDKTGAGCAATKNAGIRHAIDLLHADPIIILDDDCRCCGPTDIKQNIPTALTIDELIREHLSALEPQPVEMFVPVTDPISRGTPYFNRSATMPVAASMGFWSSIADRDACAQLVQGAMTPMRFRARTIFGQYFALSGMNMAFRSSWWPWCQFIEVPRFDDIWMGLLWQKRAYARGHCFNLRGPVVRHSRQSNVWANLRDEARFLETNETVWQRIHNHPSVEYDDLVTLVPKAN